MLKTDRRSGIRLWSNLLVIGTLMLAGGLAGCSSESPENLTQQVNQHIEKDQYTEALNLLDDATNQSKADSLQEKVHLNYGLYLEYRGGDREMRARMTGALEQFIKVLEINPANQKALNEIKQIMGVYSTMPDKNPPEEILKELDRLGIAY